MGQKRALRKSMISPSHLNLSRSRRDKETGKGEGGVKNDSKDALGFLQLVSKIMNDYTQAVCG